MRKTIATTVLALAVVILSGVLVSAQPPQQPPSPEQRDQPRTPLPPPPPPDLADEMFPPEMIMAHQRELALTDEQKAFMRGEINKTSARFNDLQWQLQDAMEALHDAMRANQVNEQQALAQLDKVLDAEREIKKLHMGLAIRIKNALTPEQQEKLQNMRHERHGPYGGGPDGGGPGPRPRKPGGLGPGAPGGLGPGGSGGPEGAPRGRPF